ncbi:MAG: GerAB/ArcD/ProY family transporter [Bacillota bacterium]|jgi:spore germination protein
MKNTISSYQWLATLTAPVTSVLMTSYVMMTVRAAGRGAYIIAAIVGSTTFLLLAVVLLLTRKNAYAPVHAVAGSLFGSTAARALCALSALFFLFHSVEALNLYVYIVKLFFLPKTPVPVLSALLFLPAAYMACCGFRTFTYMTTASLLAFIMFLLLFFMTKNNYLVSNLFPLNEFDPAEILRAVPTLFLPAPTIAASFFTLPLCGDHQGLFQKALFYSVLLTLMMEFIYAMGMMYFGEEIVAKMVLPFYNLNPFFKGNLLERFDILFMLALLPIISIMTAFGISLFSVIEEELHPQRNKRQNAVIPAAAAAVVLLTDLTLNRLPLWRCYLWSNAAALTLCALLITVYAAAARRTRKI